MATTAVERARKASDARINNARERRFLRYIDEIQAAAHVRPSVIDAMAGVLRTLGYTITGPGQGEQRLG